MRPTAIPLANIVPMLLALQFAAFGWRVVREIGVGDSHRRAWLPIPDLVDVTLFATLLFTCVINPVAYRSHELAMRSVVALAATALAMHPVNMAAHYRLFSKKGRSVYSDNGRDYPLVTDQEAITLVVTAVLLLAVTFYVR